jgi:hypothetical protein
VAAWIASLLSYPLGVTILVRGGQGRFLSQFPFFYSYLTYLLVTGVAMLVVSQVAPRYFVTLFWLRFFTLVVAEFALLVEIGDHLFEHYPALRALGRLVTFGITGVFFAAYILPALLETRPSDVAVLDLVKRSALTKGMILVALFVVAHYYRIHLGWNVTGIALGLAAYLAIHTADFALAEYLGRQVYEHIFRVAGPISHVVSLGIWTAALWRYAPAQPAGPSVASGESVLAGSLAERLGRYNATLDKLLRK